MEIAVITYFTAKRNMKVQTGQRCNFNFPMKFFSGANLKYSQLQRNKNPNSLTRVLFNMLKFGTLHKIPAESNFGKSFACEPLKI